MLNFALLLWRFVRATREALTDPAFRPIFVLVMTLLASGTVFYHRVEGWRWFDALYFCVITLATIGYGDFSPRTDLGKGFTMVYAIVGIGLLLAFINAVAARAQDRVRMRRHRHQLGPDSDEQENKI
jgi:voltage-gated potassium channel